MYKHVEKPKGKNKRSVSQKKGDGKQVAGLVDNRREVVAQHQPQEILNNGLHVSQFTSSHGSHNDATIQRTEKDAKKYVKDNGLWRPGLNLYELMAMLYYECSPEYDAIYQRLIASLPETPVPATDGYDPPTIYEVDDTLHDEIESKRDSMGEPMPTTINKKIRKWSALVSEEGIARREGKTSSGKIKRAKMMNAGGRDYRLYHTKTAPTKNEQLPGSQGQSAFFRTGEDDYFRTGANNPQRGILGLEGKRMQMGDPGFVSLLSGLHSIKDGKESKPLLKNPMGHGLYGYMDYSHEGQAHPGPKLGAEINSFTYNQLLQDNSDPRPSHYEPDLRLGVPKEYLDKQQYFHQLWYMTDGHQDVDGNYEAELFDHYQRIVLGVRDIYGDNQCEIDGYSLQIVQANMGGESNFYDYPAVIFEPTDKSQLQVIKAKIVEKWNRFSEIKMTERQSFGFLYPSISDLEKSIRIWPGQYQIDAFLSILRNIIIPAISMRKIQMTT